MGLNKKITIIFVACVLFGALFDLYILKRPQSPTIDYLPYIFGSISFLMGVYSSLLCFKIYTPKYKTVEQALRVDNLLRAWGNWGKFGAIFMILFGAYTLIRHDPNMYRLNSTIENNKWTDKDKAVLIKNCIKGAVVASKKYPKITLDYCTCAIDKVMASVGRKEYIENSSKSANEQYKIDLPLIQGCEIIFNRQVDSAKKHGN
ncbi:MAG TPA: hypothetical protein VFE53_25275 [Mucilaginibacter sp.]|nr:hypothetical protein [Mucilaginibacter sp.]